MSDSLLPHGQQHIRLPCLLPSHGVYSNSRSLSRWYHPTISSSVGPFFSCPQSFPESASFPVTQLFASGGQSIGASASHQSFLWTFMVDFLISGGLPSMGSHRVRHDWSDLAAAAAWLFPVLTLRMLVHWNSFPCVFHSSISLKFFSLKIMRNKNQELKSRGKEKH